MGIAQIGKSFRNEISPRGGLIRMREFDMAELEYFIDPEINHHPKIDKIKDIVATFYPREGQEKVGFSGIKMSFREALESQLIKSEPLAYYVALSYKFCLDIDMLAEKIRLRQHMMNEMAHYACDCWDIEIMINDDWIECIGIANRQSYDLKAHAKATGQNFDAQKRLEKPVKTTELNYKLNKNALFGENKENAKMIMSSLKKMSIVDLESCKKSLESKG